MKYSTKTIIIKAENIVGLITVEKFGIPKLACKCSTFVKSLLVAPWPLTLAGLILAGANSKHQDCKQKGQKMKHLPKTWLLGGKQFEDFRRKKEQKHYFRTFKKTQWNTGTLNASIDTHGP